MMTEQNTYHNPLSVLIVGAGLGGLSCAIACLRQGLSVTVLEKAQELGEIGAGIQIPPNAMRVMDHFGLIPAIIDAGAVKVETLGLFRYADGSPVAVQPGDAWRRRHFGYSWLVIHRADYHRVLVKEAERLGATIRLASDVVSADPSESSVLLASGEKMTADVIIGADGLRSVVRTSVIGYQKDATETGDLAYRATIPRERVEALNEDLLHEAALRAWVGPGMHAVLYPVRNREVFNLVLLCPDDLPSGMATGEGDIHEMRSLFKGWDPRLTALIAQVPSVLKWKICHMKELDTWCKGSVALLGDACHPSLPYQAQGAAMAVEDGATLGILLGRFSKAQLPVARIPDVLRVYELARKERTTTNVEGAVVNRWLYHMDDTEAEARDKAFAAHDWDDESIDFPYRWGSLNYTKQLMGFDAMAEAERAFNEWLAKL